MLPLECLTSKMVCPRCAVAAAQTRPVPPGPMLGAADGTPIRYRTRNASRKQLSIRYRTRNASPRLTRLSQFELTRGNTEFPCQGLPSEATVLTNLSNRQLHPPHASCSTGSLRPGDATCCSVRVQARDSRVKRSLPRWLIPKRSNAVSAALSPFVLSLPALADADVALPADPPPPGACTLPDLPLELPQFTAPDLEALIPSAGELPNLDAIVGNSDALVVLGAGAAVVALAFALSLVLGNKGFAGEVSPEAALKAVEEGKAVLLDIRSAKERREDGTPAVKPAEKGQPALVAVPFLKNIVANEFETEEGFEESVLGSKAGSFPADVIVLDSSGADEIAVAAAKALTSAGLKRVKVVQGGADAWKDAGLPWRDPILTLPTLPSLSMGEQQITQGLKTAVSSLADAAEKTQEQLPGVLGLLAAVGLTAAVVIEAETLFQLAASLAAGQLFFSKLLFAKDREQTFKELQAFLAKDRRAKASTVNGDKGAAESEAEPDTGVPTPGVPGQTLSEVTPPEETGAPPKSSNSV